MKHLAIVSNCSLLIPFTQIYPNNHLSQFFMKPYVIKFEFFGKKMCHRIDANDAEEAISLLRNKIKVHEVGEGLSDKEIEDAKSILELILEVLSPKKQDGSNAKSPNQNLH